MGSSFSSFVNNTAEGIHKNKCKLGHDNKKYKTCWIKYEDCKCWLEYTNVKDYLMVYRCLYYNKNYQKKFHENLKKRFANTYTFSSHDINKTILLLKKVFSYSNTWMISKSSIKHFYLKKKIFTVT